jgi:hypothetical protein
MRADAAPLAAAAALVCTAAIARPTAAQDYFTAKPEELHFRIERERTRTQRIVVVSLLGGAAVFAGIGALFSLDYRDKADSIEATGSHTGRIYTAEIDAKRDDALMARDLSIASFGLGGGLLVAAAVYYVITDPGTQAVRYGPNGEIVPVSSVSRDATEIVPVAGGVVVGRRWSF